MEELKENESIQKSIQKKWREYVIDHFKTKIPNVYDIDYVLYGTTLIGVLITNNIKLYLQIGDGDIVEYGNEFNLVEYTKESKVKGVLNSMYLDDAYKYIDLKIEKANKLDVDSIVLFSDGFTNSFRTYKDLDDNLKYTINQYRKNVFTKYNLKKNIQKIFRNFIN
ncbi:protein phosphatase 2C domain-containing protein [Paraclostridium bifermentans]|uniref:protein phosphatase 2C domain-containing protein n=1 Tax=Paraclostridium bifermentans TaxID=1490 RepID=UPI0021C28776|nr:protein phosphatase 2C domain-containing protein [Paraclostridium bifermentans]